MLTAPLLDPFRRSIGFATSGTKGLGGLNGYALSQLDFRYHVPFAGSGECRPSTEANPLGLPSSGSSG